MTVANAIGLPRLFTPYQFGGEFHPYCRCRSIDPQRMAPGALEWEVTCVYTTPEQKDGAKEEGGHDSKDSDGGGTGEEKDEQFDNPLAAIPELETHWQTEKVPIYGVQGSGISASVSHGSSLVATTATALFTVGDPVTIYAGKTVLNTTVSAITDGVNITLGTAWTGSTGTATIIDVAFKPLASSAGEIFVPPPMMDRSTLLITMTRNESILSPIPETALLFQDSVNADVFFGFGPGQVKCQSITCQRQNKQLPDGSIFPYLRATYLFHARKTWDIQLLDKGSYYRFRVSTSLPWTKQKFITDDGQPRDGLLDGFGQKLADGAAPVFITVRPYPWLTFAALELPQNFQQVQ